jgi:hypothetical protein
LYLVGVGNCHISELYIFSTVFQDVCTGPEPHRLLLIHRAYVIFEA